MYSKLFKLLDDNTKLKSFITNMSSGYIEIPYIFSETLKILQDDSVFINIISDSNKVALCNMMSSYFSNCWEAYMDNVGLDKLLKFGKIEIYKVDAANGLRYATVNEIAQAVHGIIGENTYPIGEDYYKLLALFQWTIDGSNYWFKQAGFKLNYTDDGKVTNTFYEMITISANKLLEMFDYISNTTLLDKNIKILKKFKKSNGYKYATYEKDEIKEDVTIKQLVYNIYTVFPRNSTNKDYRKALALAIKAYKNNVKLSVLEVSWLRDVYSQFALSNNRSSLECNEQLKAECEQLINMRMSGVISKDHFAYKIIETLQKSNYSKCSPRQYEVIKSALNIINKGDNKSKNTESTTIISEDDIDKSITSSDMSISSLSDAIGQGLFEEGD